MTAIPWSVQEDDLDALEEALRRIRRQLPGTLRERPPSGCATSTFDKYDGEALIAKARAIYRGRRSRERIFQGFDLFAEPAWDLLLDLFIATEKDKFISVSSATIAASVAPTTALRWLDTLEKLDLVKRSPDPYDRRRSFVSLTAKGLALTGKAIAAA